MKIAATVILFGIAATPVEAVAQQSNYTISVVQKIDHCTVTNCVYSVTATGQGGIIPAGLSPLGGIGLTSQDVVIPQGGTIITGPTGAQPVQLFGGSTLHGPTSFGDGAAAFATQGSGDIVGITQGQTPNGDQYILVLPSGLGSFLESTAEFEVSGALGAPPLTPGTYVWSWGAGTQGDNSVSLVVGGLLAAPIPEPSTWAIMLLGFAGLGFAGYRAQRKSAAGGRTLRALS
jgi:PEP-CTERM motif